MGKEFDATRMQMLTVKYYAYIMEAKVIHSRNHNVLRTVGFIAMMAAAASSTKCGRGFF